MSSLIEDIKNRAVVPAEQKPGAGKERISRYEMVVLPIWFGKRNIDEAGEFQSRLPKGWVETKIWDCRRQIVVSILDNFQPDADRNPLIQKQII